MQIRTLKHFTLICALLASVNSIGQVNWYWTKQADSAEEFAAYDAVDRNNNAYYTGYCIGTRISFGNIGLDITGSEDDFLVKYGTNGNVLWARNATALSPSSNTVAMSVATDRNNDVLEAGYISDSVAFGSYHLYSGNRYENTYVVKYDGNGNVLWATTPIFNSVYSYYYNQAYSVAADKNNNVLVAGYFEDTVVFGNDTLLSNALDMYLVKYDPSGNVLWAKAPVLGVTLSSECYGESVAVDDSGNSYVGGSFQDSVSFGPTKLYASTMNIYLAKYDPAGNVKWAVNIPADPGSVYPTPVTIDRSGNVYIASQFNNPTLTLGPSTVMDNYSPCSNSLVAKFDHNGNVLWATCANNISSAEVCVIVESSLATDRCNNVYWSGICSDTFAVGNVSITVQGGGSHPSRPFSYIIKLDSNGSPIGGAGLANQSTEYFSNGLAVDSLSRVYFDAVLSSPAILIIGNDTVRRYSSESTSFLSKFSIVPVIANSNKNDSICPGDSIVLKVPPGAGTTYLWSTGAKTDSIIAKPLITTNYYVVVSDNCNMDTSFIKIFVTPLKITIKGSADSICKGDSVILTAGGGTTYKWSTGATNSSISVKPLSDSTYTLTAYSGNCNNDTTFTIHVVPTPTAVISPAVDSVCQGDSIQLTGNGGVTYKWSTGKTSSSIWVKPLTATTYTLHAYSGACSDSTIIKVNVFSKITASVQKQYDSICSGQSDMLTAVDSGGTATYKWNTGATSSTITVTPSVTTTYTATVFGKCDSVQETITVNVAPSPTAVISGTLQKCKGMKDTLVVSGGTKYLWSNGKTTTNYYTGDINSDSTITVIAYNSLGCSDTVSFTITIMPSPSVTVYSSPPKCPGQPVLLTAIASGTGPFTYSWLPGGKTTDTITVSPTNPANYTITVSNGCKQVATITVTPDVPVLTACCSTTILLGDDTIITAGGPNMASYKWIPGTSLNCDTCPTVIATPTITTTYTVIGTDSSGCQTERIVTIVVEEPCFNFIVPNVFTPDFAGPNAVNNLFYIKTENLSAWSITIYDRWGKEMFKSTNPIQYWDGSTEGGSKAPDGVYYYIISATCQGNTYKKDGFVQLIR